MCKKQFSTWGLASLFAVVSLIAANPDARLAKAAKEMDRASVRTLLEQRLDVNASQVDGMTALHWAAYQDDLETVELLVRAGADVQAANRYGVTPLSLACANRNEAMVGLLLKAGADPNTALPGGETALMTAARTGRVEAVRALISAGADVNAKEKKGQTALMWAAAEGHVAAVEALIQAGADFRARSNSGFTPLLFAVREARAGVVRALLKAGADVNESIPTAGRRGSGRRYESGAATSAGTSALVLAVTNAHYELASVLLDAGADPNAADSGMTALHVISGVRKPGTGSNDPAPPGSGNMTSLELVKKLVEHGANVNAPITGRANLRLSRLNPLGATPLLLAARTADAELMRTLVALGADARLPNADNTTLLLVAAGVGTHHPGEDAGTESEVLEAVKVALDLGADLNAIDNNGETAMHGAAYKHVPAVAQFLLDKGAKIEIWNQKNKFGVTPLMIAKGYKDGNFEPSPETAAVLRRVMSAAGVSMVVEPGPLLSPNRAGKD